MNKTSGSFKDRLDSFDSLITAKKDTLYTFDSKTKNLDKKLTDISDKITITGNKNIVKQDFYITDNLKFSLSIDDKIRFNFKDLKTLAGNPFPTFDKAPFLMIVPQNSAIITLV
jgi:5'(3')-deoxyribonucleotidase